MTRYVGRVQKFRIHGCQGVLKGFLHMDENPDGTLAMIAIDTHKEGTMVRAMAQGFASAVNLGIASGVPLESFVREFQGTRFEPAGQVEGSPFVAECSSLLDYVVREIEANYLTPKEPTC